MRFKTPEELFGFSSLYSKVEKELKEKNIYSELPVQSLRTNEVFKELTKLGDVGGWLPKKFFEGQVLYGEGVGAIQISISPLGSLKINLKRSLIGNDGESYYVCKEVIPLVNDFNHRDSSLQETVLSGHIYDKVKKLRFENLDYPDSSYKDFQTLVKNLAINVRKNHPEIFLFDKVVRYQDDYYQINLNYRGQGQETPGGRKVYEFVIHMNYDKKSGLIRSWGNEISTLKSKQVWEIQPSEWNEYFAPSQSEKQIINVIQSILSTY